MSNSAQEYAETIVEELLGVEDAWEYVGDALDYRIKRDSSNDLVAVELLVTSGGPTAWVAFDSYGTTVKVSWGGDVATIEAGRMGLAENVLDYFADILA